MHFSLLGQEGEIMTLMRCASCGYIGDDFEDEATCPNCLSLMTDFLDCVGVDSKDAEEAVDPTVQHDIVEDQQFGGCGVA